MRIKTFPPEIPRDFVDYPIERLVLRSSKTRRLTKKILKAQHTLRLTVPTEGWDAYLELERLVNERAAGQFEDLLRATLDFAAWRGDP
jgi:hypothetical protein